jgi:hypothetical protein
VYLTVERPFFRWSKTAHLIVNGSVKCHPDGQKLVIIDADGFRHQAAITKQILKPAGPGQPPSETKSPPATQAGLKPMTNEDVLTLKSAGFGDDFIVTKIRASVPGFNLDIADLVKLKQAGLSDSVVAAMVRSAAAK